MQRVFQLFSFFPLPHCPTTDDSPGRTRTQRRLSAYRSRSMSTTDKIQSFGRALARKFSSSTSGVWVCAGEIWGEVQAGHDKMGAAMSAHAFKAPRGKEGWERGKGCGVRRIVLKPKPILARTQPRARSCFDTERHPFLSSPLPPFRTGDCDQPNQRRIDAAVCERGRHCRGAVPDGERAHDGNHRPRAHVCVTHSFQLPFAHAECAAYLARELENLGEEGKKEQCWLHTCPVFVVGTRACGVLKSKKNLRG